MMSASYQTITRLCTHAGGGLFRARRTADGMLVLVKQLDSHATDTARAVRFRREYGLLQALKVPAVVKPLALIEEDGNLAIILEDFPGESLEEVLADGTRMDTAACLRTGISMAGMLAGIHAAHVIHRDIRPVNLLVARASGNVQLADFSIALALEQETLQPEGDAATIGDWAYVSPEQTGRMNQPVDCRTDFYSLGVTLYRMLTGRLPFQGNDALEWMHCHIARTPLPPRDIAPDIPEPVSAIVMKLLAKLPEDRYQTAHGLQADLERCLAQWQAEGRADPFALGAEDVPDRLLVPHRLYGREEETATLLAAFDGLAASGKPSLVTVSGYSGVGKSSLVQELRQPIVRERGYFIAGKFDQVMRDIPYATLTQAFRELVRQLLSESEARVADWRQQILEAVGANGQVIVDVLPQVELIIGSQPPVPPLPPAQAQNRFRMVFRRFMGVFARREHPLTLFLDDMQWADAASMQFIEDLLAHPDTGYLLLIAAYRDNEVGAAHPLHALLDAIRSGPAAMTEIRLAPLTVEHLNRLVADALRAQSASCMSLTQLVFERTEGNPFFFTRFLEALNQEGVLRYDQADRAWRYDLAQIRGRDFADNVADLMAGKLRRLPAQVQEALQLAACLGNRFELRALALAGGFAEEEAARRLSPAVEEDLIARTDGHGKFLHDRIQQAAHALIPEAHRAEVHLRIARALAAGMTPDENASHLFDVANQFNLGAALLTDPGEKARVAELELRAGRRAKASAAYASACVYLEAGMALLGEQEWHSRHELMFSLHMERAECEFLRGRFDIAGQLIAVLLARAASKHGLAAVYRLKIDFHVVQSENPEAVDSALACLRLFGIDLPAHPSPEQVQAAYDEVWQTLGGRAIESFAEQPLLADPDIDSAVDTLMTLTPPAAYTDPRLLTLVLCRTVNLSLRHGASGAGAAGYASFGVILASMFRRYADSHRFGQLGCMLVERHRFTAFAPRVYLAAGVNAFFTQPVAAAIDFERKVIRLSGEAGSLADACNAWTCIVGASLLQGVPLDAVWRDAERGLDFVRSAKYQDDVNVITSEQRFIAAMQGKTAAVSSFGDAPGTAGGFDEAAFETRLEQDRTAMPIGRYRLLKMQACFLAGDLPGALDAMRKTKELFWSIAVMVHLSVNYHTFSALTLGALYDDASADEQRAWREELAVHLDQLREWADAYPPTFGDKHALVAAEIARIDGRDLDAMRLYEEAIQSAREHGFVQYEGMAHEAAAGFFHTRGSATASRAHLQEARACFARWGADGKVRQLEARYPQLRAQPSPATTQASGVADVKQLDALSVAKASQAISGRIVLGELIDTLMRILLENAGAQHGALLLMRGETPVLAAEAGVSQQEVQVRLHLGETVTKPDLPMAVLNYVRRSQVQVLLDDTSQPHPFPHDPYLLQRRPKSVLCIPIVRQTTLVGLLYLENTLVTHAFTPERVTLLEVLASQAAISLENASLYADLQQENIERKRIEAALREREMRIRRLVDSNIIGVFFWDAQGRIGEANDAFLRLIGYSRDDLVSGKVQWMNFNPPEYDAADALRREEIQRTGSVSSYEKEFVRKDGTRIPVLIGSALLEGTQNSGVGFVLDLTERRQAETERAARQVADAANRAKSEFLANMSHELRTPLNGILGYAQILQRDRTLDAKQVAALNVIRQCGDHLLTLINDILDLSKIEAGKLELSYSDIPLSDFLRVLAEMVSVKAEQKGLEFIRDFAPDLPRVIRADEKRLRQVLLNLLSNAVKFTDRGRVTLRARMMQSSRLRFDVQDTGTGIEADKLETIFDPFEQVGDIRRRQGGTGLGLAISRQFVRLMGSEIRVDSRVGKGSCFWFEIDVPVLDKVPVLLSSEAVVTGYEGPRRRILVADDVIRNRALAIDMLEPLGFSMAEAENGREALEKARDLQPDLILMDIVMPEMDGLEAMRRLRGTPGLQEIPVIAVSANASGGDESSSLAAGANAFLPKPLNLGSLLSRIGSLLALKWMEASTPAVTDELTNEVLEAPPAEEMEILHHLARLGNMQDILQRAAYLSDLDKRYRPFADRLALLARGYRSKAILNLVERYLERNRVQ